MINRLRENFTQISNDILSDKDLSLKAKGLYAFLCSKPDDWNFTYDGLSFQLQEGEKAIRSAVRELVEASVLLRIPRTKPGGFDGWEWIINPSAEDISKHVDPMKYPPQSSPSQSSPLREVPKTGSSQNGYHISNTDSSNTNLSNKEKVLACKKEFEELIEREPESATAKTAFYFMKLGWKPKESVEDLREWIVELAESRKVNAEELKHAVKEWYLYWSAHPEKPVKNHKNSLGNTPLLNKDKWKKN